MHGKGVDFSEGFPRYVIYIDFRLEMFVISKCEHGRGAGLSLEGGELTCIILPANQRRLRYAVTGK